MVGGTMNASNRSNVFSPMLIEFSVMRIGDFPYETIHPRTPRAIGRFHRWGTAVAWGSQARKIRK